MPIDKDIHSAIRFLKRWGGADAASQVNHVVFRYEAICGLVGQERSREIRRLRDVSLCPRGADPACPFGL